VANCYTAIELGRRSDSGAEQDRLPAADPEGWRKEIEDVIGVDASEAVLCSAKTGLGIEECSRWWCAGAAAAGDPEAPLKALIIDSWFDNYVGVVMLVRVVDGVLKPKDKHPADGNGAQYPCEQVGVFTPSR
jgi:GTP-binding protein LepA